MDSIRTLFIQQCYRQTIEIIHTRWIGVNPVVRWDSIKKSCHVKMNQLFFFTNAV